MALNWIASLIVAVGVIGNLYEATRDDATDTGQIMEHIWMIVFGVVVLVAVWR